MSRTPVVPAWMRVAAALAVVGWGANHFAPLLPVYRSSDHLSQTTVSAMFAAYVLGLAPALIAAALIGRRFGHRLVLRAVVLGAIASSALLALAGGSEAGLFVGRVAYGACMGAAMAPGTTWIKELSADAPAGTGARRAAIALSAGFGGGPVVSGILAQWAPAPQVLPYLVHIVAMAATGALAWNAPQPRIGLDDHVVTVDEQPPVGREAHLLRRREFWSRIAPGAPWVFTCASVALVTVPAVIADQMQQHVVLVTGLMAGATLGTGVIVQPHARRLEARRGGLTVLLGSVAAVVGLVLVLAIDRWHSLLLAALIAVVLGCGYGLNLVGGLTQVEHLSTPGELALTNAVFYCLTYLGFFVPMLLSAAAATWSFSAGVLVLGAAAVLTCAAAARRLAGTSTTRA